MEAAVQIALRRPRPRLAGVLNKSVSLLATFFAIPQLLRGMGPVVIRRTFWTTSCLPEPVSQRRNVVVPKHGEGVLVHGILMRLRSVSVSQLGMLKSLSRALLPGFVILLLMGLRGTQMSMRGIFV